LSSADTPEFYCYDRTGEEWPNTHTHTYEDTHTPKKKATKKQVENKRGRKEKKKKRKRGEIGEKEIRGRKGFRGAEERGY